MLTKLHADSLFNSNRSVVRWLVLGLLFSSLALPLARAEPTFEQTITWLTQQLKGGSINVGNEIHHVEYTDGWLKITHYVAGDPTTGTWTWWIDPASLSGTASRKKELRWVDVVSNGKNPITWVKNYPFKKERSEEITRSVSLKLGSPEDNQKLARALDHAAKLRGVKPAEDLF